MEVQKGTFRSVSSAYGIHHNEIMETFLANGWLLKSKTDFNSKTGNCNVYYTFEAGENANDITELGLPNAHILK